MSFSLVAAHMKNVLWIFLRANISETFLLKVLQKLNQLVVSGVQ